MNVALHTYERFLYVDYNIQSQIQHFVKVISNRVIFIFDILFVIQSTTYMKLARNKQYEVYIKNKFVSNVLFLTYKIRCLEHYIITQKLNDFKISIT